MVAKFKKIKVPSYHNTNYFNLREFKDGSIINPNPWRFGGIYASSLLAIEFDGHYNCPVADAWYKAYKEYIPNDAIPERHGNQLLLPPAEEFERENRLKALVYAREKNIVDTLGPIKVLDADYTSDALDNFSCKYVDANENLGPNTYRFKMLNPIYNKVGNWWLGDKGQPIMAVPNNLNSYDGEPVVPKSYDDYLTYTDDEKNLIAKYHEEIEHPSLGPNESAQLYIDASAPNFGIISDAIPNYINGQNDNGEDQFPLDSKGSMSVRDKTPLEFMSPYNPDVLVPEDKLNELAKEHPEVWKPMIFEYKGYKSICVSTNGYIISAYQPAPNVFLPIHIYGVSDHRGPDGYDAAKSVIITIKNLVLYTDHGEDEIYHEPDTNGAVLIDSNTVKTAYDDMMKAVGK